LSVPGALADGTYNVTATVTDLAGNATSDLSSGELEIDTSGPAAPTVSSLVTNYTTPTLPGTFDASDSSGGLSVKVGATTYVLGVDSQLSARGDNWVLILAGTTPLAEGSYDVVVTATES